MSQTLQDFLVQSMYKAAADLETAVLNIPEDKRSWSPGEKTRTALNMAAECAILTGYTAELCKTRVWSNDAYSGYGDLLAKIGGRWEDVKDLLNENLPIMEAAIRAVPDSDLEVPITMPWSTMTLAQVLAYPYWNMSYHEGQMILLHQLVTSDEIRTPWSTLVSRPVAEEIAV